MVSVCCRALACISRIRMLDGCHKQELEICTTRQTYFFNRKWEQLFVSLPERVEDE